METKRVNKMEPHKVITTTNHKTGKKMIAKI